MRRVAAIDCGTNSLRLLIAEAPVGGTRRDGARRDGARREGGPLRDVVRRSEIVRLGQGVDVTGRIAPEALERALAVSAEYARVCRESDVEAIRYVATSASRDARNAGEFVDGVRACFEGWGVAPEVISGREEAALSFRGATAAVAAAGFGGEYLVVDLGGGSTEFVRGARTMRQAISVDVGCVRMTERHLRADPPTPAEAMALRAATHVALDRVEAAVGLSGVRTLVGLAGTVTTLTAHALALDSYADARVHLAQLTCAQTLDACASLAAMSRHELASLPYVHPGRVDVMAAGALIWATIVERVRLAAGEVPVVTSVHDLLDGIAQGLADGR